MQNNASRLVEIFANCSIDVVGTIATIGSYGSAIDEFADFDGGDHVLTEEDYAKVVEGYKFLRDEDTEVSSLLITFRDGSCLVGIPVVQDDIDVRAFGSEEDALNAFSDALENL